LGGGDFDRHRAIGIHGLIGVDDFHGEGETEFDLDFLGLRVGGGEDAGIAVNGGFAGEDAELGVGWGVDEDDGFARGGVAGEGVLEVGVAEEDFVAGGDDEFFAIGLGGGVDFGMEDAGGGAGFGGEVGDGWLAALLDVDVEGVVLRADVHVEVGDFGDDALTGFDAEEFLAGAGDRAAAGAGEVERDGSDLAVVVSGGEGLGEKSVRADAAGGEFVEVGDLDGIAGGEFEGIVFGEFEDVLGGRDVGGSAALEFDVADGDGFAAVFEELVFEVAEIA